jgi:hydroxypyruvate reductase
LQVVAAGKAAWAMAPAFLEVPRMDVRQSLAIGSNRRGDADAPIEWLDAGHPLPDDRSVQAGHRALKLARQVEPHGRLVLLLSGGASALMAAPADGVTLAEKQQVIRAMMHAGADIHALNAVRKHISAVKGGRLAAVCRGGTTTLAVSDVVGDDISVIGSGPGVADPTTWADALEALTTWGGGRAPETVLARFRRGSTGAFPDTPKPGDAALARTSARVIGGRSDALEGARREALSRGYHVAVMEDPVVGDARVTARAWLGRTLARAAALNPPACVLSAGETTVRVTGRGKGGRNQEFALSLAGPIGALGAPALVASVGTDGIDGPTDAAGAYVDDTTMDRAQTSGIGTPEPFLEANDAYAFLAPLGHLIRLGPTDTNVGDLQVLLLPESRARWSSVV